MVKITRRSGFTLIELLVVVLIIGILAAIAVPQYFKVVEKGRFAEATSCFSIIKGAQERYMLKYNTYTNNPNALDVSCPTGKAFQTVQIPQANNASYQATLRRGTFQVPAPQTYGSYTVTYVGPAGTFSCDNASCTTDLLP